MQNPLAIADELIRLTAQVATERNLERLLGEIVASARRLTRAEGGQILVLDRSVRYLRCVVGQNDVVGASGPDLEPVPIYDSDARYNLRNASVFASVTGRVVNVPDIYRYSGFDFTAAYHQDRRTGYRTQSFVAVPLWSAERTTLGVLQLVNLRLTDDGEIGALPDEQVRFVTSFAAHAAVAISITRLFEENQRLIRQLDKEATELQEENQRLRREAETAPVSGIVGESPAIRQAIDLARRAASSPRVGVLLLGETGTGKDVFASAIHQMSQRAGKPFVVQNCAAVPETLLESELFGHRKGAFSGAVVDKKGLVQEADGGTLFLDEIGEMPLGLQAKILRLLEDGSVRRIGDTRAEKSDIRVVAATNADLPKKIANGSFREDLYYRLSVFPIRLPALRERPTDIPLLIEYFLMRASKANGRTTPFLTPRALDVLGRWHFPGNVRELRNVMERSLLLADEGERIDVKHLPPEISADVAIPSLLPEGKLDAIDLKEIVQQYEAQMIEKKLQEAGWNQSKAAKMLRISRRSLVDKLSRYAIRSPVSN